MFLRASVLLIAACNVLPAQTNYPTLGMTPPPSTYPILGTIIRADPKLDSILAPDAKLEMLASGFDWSEGPAWDRRGGYLVFSDIPRNTVWKWAPQNGITLFLKPSGYTGPGDHGLEPGSNGLMYDAQGRLISMEHGDRRVSRMDRDGGKTTLVDRYENKRLNSPNDGAIHSNGDIYFTDPPYGLPKGADDPRREMDYCGVFRYSVRTGQVTLLTKELSRPNGIAFSPDEKTLYVANSDPKRAVWTAFPVKADGTLGAGRVIGDVTAMVGKHKGLPDGMKVAHDGTLFATGPGGVHIMTPEGKLLGRIETYEATGNCTWGDDGSTLYVMADTYICRIKTKTKGAGW